MRIHDIVLIEKVVLRDQFSFCGTLVFVMLSVYTARLYLGDELGVIEPCRCINLESVIDAVSWGKIALAGEVC